MGKNMNFNTYTTQALDLRPNTEPQMAESITVISIHDWDRIVRSRLAQIAALPVGWDGYGSERIGTDIRSFAREILYSSMTKDQMAPSIVPISGGGLQLEWHTFKGDIELEIGRPYQTELYVAFTDGRPTIEKTLGADFSELTKALKEIA
jgi:hypothetical protein